MVLKTDLNEEIASSDYCNWLVVWNMIFFHAVENYIIPTDKVIFFRRVGRPPTR